MLPFQDREAILHVQTANMPLEDVSLKRLAQLTDGYSGADLENICKEVCSQISIQRCVE